MIYVLVPMLLLLLLFWIRWRYRNRRILEFSEKLPGPKSLPLLGNALTFMCRPEEFVSVITDYLVKYGDVSKFWLGPDLNIIVRNPDDIKILLSSTNVSVKGPQYKYMADVLGDGLLSGSGSTWRKHRKIASPNYNKRAIKSYMGVINREADLLLENLQNISAGKQFSIYDCIVQATTFSVCQNLMGLTKTETLSLPYLQEIIKSSPKLYGVVFARMTKWYLQITPIFWLTKSYQLQKKFVYMLTELSKTIVQIRLRKLSSLDKEKLDQESAEDDLSVVDRFILSSEFDFSKLLTETFTVFTSSQEATAKISSFFLLMMAYHPHCQEKLYAEIQSVLGDSNGVITFEDFKRMPYLDMVFKEILRLYPIGAMLQRTVSEDITISTGTIPAGCSLVIPIYYMHRDPRFWTNPNNFDPEHFSSQNIKTRPPNCYIPFSLGPMDCLGRHYAAYLVKIICVKILQKFQITSLNKYEDLRITISISAVSIDGYNIIINQRH